jgi:hypothetical protein
MDWDRTHTCRIKVLPGRPIEACLVRCSKRVAKKHNESCVSSLWLHVIGTGKHSRTSMEHPICDELESGLRSIHYCSKLYLNICYDCLVGQRSVPEIVQHHSSSQPCSASLFSRSPSICFARLIHVLCVHISSTNLLYKVVADGG